jgi:hypothetical protein
LKNRVFFPQGALDEWVAGDLVDLDRDELTIRSEGRKYRIVEAVRILREVAGSPDVHELVGRVKSVGYLAELGAELLEQSMIIGEAAYDVVPGFAGAPIGTFEEHRQETKASVESDEELLAAFLAKSM